MNAAIKKSQKILGFTLVELMIVIGVISVLVTIVSFSYRGAQHSSAVATVKSDLTQAGTKIKTEKLNSSSGVYSSTVPSSVKVSDNVVLQVTVAADNGGFCVDGSHERYGDIHYYYSSDQGLGEGLCSELTAYVPPVIEDPGPTSPPSTAPIVNASNITNSTATYGWTALEDANGYAIQWRVNGGAWTLVDMGSTMSAPMGAQLAGSVYELQARGYNDVGDGPWSSIVSATLGINAPAWNKWNQTEAYPNWTSWVSRTDNGALCEPGISFYSEFRDGIVNSFWNDWRGLTNRGVGATSSAQYVSSIANYSSTLQAQIRGYCKNEDSGVTSTVPTTAVYTSKHTAPNVVLSGPVECAGAYSGRPTHQVRLWLQEVSYNLDANQSNVNWHLYRYSTSSTWNPYDQTKTWPWSVSIHGSGWGGSSNSIAFRYGEAGTVETIATGSLTVTHDANGNATIGYAGSDGPGSSIFGSASCSGSYGLSDLR